MKSYLRNWLLPLVGFTLAFLLSVNSSGYAQALSTADELNQEGFSFLDNGVPAEALSIWREAEDLYQREGNLEGIVGTQLNQSLAQQALGLHPLACRTITEALSVSSKICQPQAGQEMIATELAKIDNSLVSTIGLRMLGENLGALSNLEEAITTLTIAQSRISKASEQHPLTILALANAYNLSFQSALQSYAQLDYRAVIERSQMLSQVVDRSRQATSLYHQSVSSFSDKRLVQRAYLNMVGMFSYALKQDLQDLGNNLPDESWLEPLAQSAQSAYSELDSTGFGQLPAIESIYARLNLADSLLSIKSSGSQWSWGDSIAYADIKTLTEAAASLAEQIDNNRARASAYGITGDLLTQTNSARSLISEQYGRALSLAQSVRAYDLSYEWAYRLAHLSEQSGEVNQAEQYYQNAIAALSNVRDDLLAVNSELRFSFRKQIEPVYRDYMKLLAAKEEPDLERISQVHDSLQLAQLENFLRCGRLLSVEQRSGQITVHVIDLGDTIQVVVTHNGRSYGYKSAANDMFQAANSLAINTQSENFLSIHEEEFLPYVQRLYDGLLRPAAEAGLLQDNREITFILDAPFQSVPMGMLHDGKQYLAAKHPISISLQMQRVRSLAPSSNALFVGLSESAPSFNEVSDFSDYISPLPETEFEALYLENYIDAKALLNQEFTLENVSDALTDTFDVVHISTHGQFSSTPEQTFLLAWDEPIGLTDLGRLFRRTEGTNLLFLSACQAAAGDDRATLGLAGLAIQAGARNVVAPLWLQDSTGGSVLIDSFYKSLAAEMSISEGLQQAQINLMKSAAFSHPYYWAPFVLVAS